MTDREFPPAGRAVTSDDDWFHAERLHRAAADGDIALAKDLVAEGVPLDAFDDIGFTPLHFAVRHGHFALVQLLLAAGADIDAREVQTHSNTAVSVAAREASPEMVEFLLGRGADPWITGWMGIDAFAAARLRKDENAPRVRAVLESHAKSRKRTG